jgi:cellulose synthase/poly-beta-1,6-N-acetylglucosamine synthase-like glycosyltransferase
MLFRWILDTRKLGWLNNDDDDDAAAGIASTAITVEEFKNKVKSEEKQGRSFSYIYIYILYARQKFFVYPPFFFSRIFFNFVFLLFPLNFSLFIEKIFFFAGLQRVLLFIYMSGWGPIRE